MRVMTKAMAALVLVTASGDSGLGATNCGFLTIEQCRASVSGMGGFCVPNQFYNPQGPAKGARKTTTESTRLRDALRSLSVVRRVFGR